MRNRLTNVRLWAIIISHDEISGRQAGCFEVMFMDAQAQAEELLQLVTQSMHGMAQERAEQVTRGEGALLRYLATQHDGATAGELREALEAGSGRVSNALKNLEGKGMIMRVSSARDGRVVQVYLTERGRAAITARYQRLLRQVSELLEDVGEKDTAELLRLTRKVIDLSQKQREESVGPSREPLCSQSGGKHDRQARLFGDHPPDPGVI